MDRLADLTAQRVLQERAAPYVEWVRCLISAGGDRNSAGEIFRSKSSKHAELLAKAAVDPGRTDNAGGSALAVLEPNANAYIELTRARSAIGKMTGWRSVPFNVSVPRQTSAAGVSWNDEGAPIVVGNPAFDNVNFEFSRVSGIVVLSETLARHSSPAAQRLIETDLTKGIANFMDLAFLNPSTAAAGNSPASITNGVTPISATGTTAAALKADLRSLLADMVARGSDLESVYFVMSKIQAAAIGAMGENWTDALGPNGGSLLGVPVVATIASLVDGNSPSEEMIFAIDTGGVLLADDGIVIDASREATLQMETAPDSPATGTTKLVSMWQENLVAVKVERIIRWEAARGGASGWISGAAYAGA